MTIHLQHDEFDKKKESDASYLSVQFESRSLTIEQKYIYIYIYIERERETCVYIDKSLTQEGNPLTIEGHPLYYRKRSLKVRQKELPDYYKRKYGYVDDVEFALVDPRAPGPDGKAFVIIICFIYVLLVHYYVITVLCIHHY